MVVRGMAWHGVAWQVHHLTLSNIDLTDSNPKPSGSAWQNMFYSNETDDLSDTNLHDFAHLDFGFGQMLGLLTRDG